MATTNAKRHFLPAAGRNSLLPLYDPLTRLLGVDTARRGLLDQGALEPHHRVLDVGCGTGTLAVSIKRLHPSVTVIGVDPDPKALSRAQRKAARAGVAVRFDQGFADALGYPDATFDRVFSSMMFHHLDTDVKMASLREIRRVLRPEGRLELMDFSRPHAHRHGALSRLIHSPRQLQDNVHGRMTTLLADAGFVAAKRLEDRDLIVGHIAFFQATAPARQ